MDKNSIKKYAVWARRELIERVSQKALQYGITGDGKAGPNADSVGGRLLSNAEKSQRQALIHNINEKGYAQVMEEVAYTWFNRFAALRFMEVNGYLPSHIRVFTNDAGEFKPQILSEAIHLDLPGLNMERVYELEQATKREGLFKYLLIVQCNALNKILPGMFQKIDDYTELLFPDNLLREGSVIEQLVTTIPESDWQDQVQIIGWLYQYYNTEPKDTVFSRPSGTKIRKEDIPAATQLFTPDWIVRYMVENSLGRLWVEGHPNDALKANWKYYLEEAEQEPEVQAQLKEIRKDYAALKPEDIRCIDPCMGSGHILCYLFDVLVQIYESYGYSRRDAAQRIVQYNLYGLDIDKRATQLAYFSVMMKARQYDRRFFSRNMQPLVYCTSWDEEGENYGSLVMVDDPGERPEDPESIFDLPDYEQRLNAWSYRYILAQKYHVVVTNPPYMAVSNGNGKLQDYVKKNYPDSKSDLFAVFIERCRQLTVKNGYQAMITQHSWMFLSSFEKLREKLQKVDTVNMVHLGSRAFEEIGGEVVQTTSFVMKKSHTAGYKGTYCRLIEPTTQQGKEDMFLAGENRYFATQDNFFKIPGAPVAYWVSEAAYSLFDEESLVNSVAYKEGITTGDNEKFLRLWFEPSWKHFFLKEIDCDGRAWIPCNKGGEFRRWYGNRNYVIDWTNNGKRLKEFKGSSFRNSDFQRREGGTFSNLSSGLFSTRYTEEGFAFESKGTMYFSNDLFEIIGFMNSKTFQLLLSYVCPTLDYKFGAIQKLPRLKGNENVNCLVQQNISLSRADWDAFETSWDFQRHPLIPSIRGVWDLEEMRDVDIAHLENRLYLSATFDSWTDICEKRFTQLKANEEELNRIFIDIYGLQDELTPEVEDKDVTVHRIFGTKADVPESMRGSAYVRTLRDEIVSLISYAVGCMFGRYSPYKEGLIYAGGEWDYNQYEDMAWLADGKPDVMEFYKAGAHFFPDQDDIIPICDDEYFADDIVGRFVEFIDIVYGHATLKENLQFIANALGGKGSPVEVIRNYFLNGFYADHLKIYQKRPIYWLFDSGKKNGFKCLVYMHRYQPDTLARIRTDYVHEQQSRYRTAIADLEQRINGASTSERVKLNKRLAVLQAQAAEIREYEEKIHHLADQMIKIDLDDGVKHNYELFADVLAKIK